MRRYIHPTESDPCFSIIPNISSPQGSNSIFPWGIENFADKTCCNLPTYFRSFTQAIPNSPEVAALTKAPVGLIIQPGKVNNIPLTDLSESTVPRCSRCSAYVSCFCKVDDKKRRWTCALCGNSTPFPDKFTEIPRNLLTNCVYDVKAPQEFIQKPQIMPSFLFIIDLSCEAIDSGFTAQFIRSVKASVEQVPDFTNVCVITMGMYASIYDIKTCKEAIIVDPEEYVVSPNFIVKLSDYRQEFYHLLDIISKKTSNTRGNCLGSALKVAESALRVYGGVIVAGTCTTPSLGPFAIFNRLYAKDDVSEVKLLHLPTISNGQKYREIALKMNRRASSLHLFVYSETYSEVPISGLACGLTGGKCYYYKKFDPAQLHTDLFCTITGQYFWHASMRLRASEGLQLVMMIGNMTSYNEGLSISVMPVNSSLTFGLKVLRPITDAKFQAGFLYTATPGKRILRVFNFELPVSGDPSVLQHGYDEAALGAFFLKTMAMNTLNVGARRSAELASEDFKTLVSRNSKFKALPHIMFGALRNKIFTEPPLDNIDFKMSMIINLRMTSVAESVLIAYPMLFDVIHRKILPLRQDQIREGIFALGRYNNVNLWCTSDEYHQQMMSLLDQNGEPKGVLADFVNNLRDMTGKYLRVIVTPYKENKDFIDSFMIETVSNPDFDTWIQSGPK